MIKKLKASVSQLVLEEYARASEQHGPKHHSLAEAYAVIREELEEAQQECEVVADKLEDFWHGVKFNSGLTCNFNAKMIEEKAIAAASEMIQVAAMAHKALQGYEEPNYDPPTIL